MASSCKPTCIRMAGTTCAEPLQNLLVTCWCDVSSQCTRPCAWRVSGSVSPAAMTAKQYGPLSILALWDKSNEQAPLYLVTNLVDLDEAVRLYKKRAHIETFFSDQKAVISDP